MRKQKAKNGKPMFRILLEEFCSSEGEKLDHRLSNPIPHNNLPYDRLTYDDVSECPIMENTSDGWRAGLDCFSEDECRDILLQVSRDRVSYLTSNKDSIVDKVGIGVYARELRRLQDNIEEATVYA